MTPESGLMKRIFRWQCLFVLFHLTICSPPEDPVRCVTDTTKNCTITNSYGTFPDRSICRADEVVYPTSEEELIAAVAKATMNKKKMKVVTKYSHSIPKLVCPGGDDGVLISTRFLNRTLSVDPSTMLMTVDSGVTLREVIDGAAKAGLALPYSPYWWGLTMGGLLATGAHGSSLWGKGSSVHEYVAGIRIVTPASQTEGYATVRSLANDDPNMNAAKVSLGVIGVISQVTLKLQPLFKRSITNLVSNDSDLGEKSVSFGIQHEFGDMTWYPSQRKVVYRIDDRITSNATGNGLIDFPGFRSTSTVMLAIIRSAEEGLEATNNADLKCSNSKITTSTLMTAAYGLTNNGALFTGYPVIGYQNHVQASGSCLDSREDAHITACPWDPRIKGTFIHQTTISIGLSNVRNFIQDVQKLRDLVPNSMCGVELYNGILMRYVKSSSAYLGHQEDGLDFDITYYRSKDPMVPRLYEDILEEVEQMALFKYGGLPHWGKNRNLAFDGAVRKYDKSVDFLKVKQTYDPMGLFSNEWTDQILGIKGGVSIIKEGCALEGLCICSEDLHCAPKKGYFCRPGKVYKDARVCTRLTSPR
ncbi:putative L-gulonolactone oxidase 6 [Tasmannia lanceolata]|uniref:putative L-gulonolactone oxidase 6 n=1 Tax=Tasmannia lanceolata TaxID=3420 RepID=UPI0040649DFA